MRIAAIGDLHFKGRGNEEIISIFDGVEKEADLLILAGDLTDSGLPDEMEALLGGIKKIPLPIIAVLGNHDHEHDRADDLKRMLVDKEIQVLDGSTFQMGQVGFAGTKGFCGGFGERLIQPFGERPIKQFVQAGIEESTRLGTGLAELTTPHKIAVLHYSPVKETLEGESLEIYPFLGTSWLGDMLDRNGADFAVHGHAHNGSPEGRTAGNIPVYNVSRFVRSRIGPRAYFLLEV
jgi:Icc-related predicted phosphoesterase